MLNTGNSEKKPKIRNRELRLVQGVVLGLALPLGWLALSWLTGFNRAVSLGHQLWLYTYLILGGSVLFGGFGYLVGCREEWLNELHMRDFLTGVFNSRYFRERLPKEFSNARRYSEPLSVLLFSLEGFEDFKAAHGRKMGNSALAYLAQGVYAMIREGDTLARMGEGEFALILPRTDLDGGKCLAERLLKCFRESEFPLEKGGSAPLPLAIRLAGTEHSKAETAEEFLNEAASALNLGARVVEP